MGSNGAEHICTGQHIEVSEPNIEIKIKTLDSQTYTMRVDKQMPVPALKEQVAIVTGVLSAEQRLICRGKVLKDDQLLSAYHVEDGHTLHLVVRQPIPPSSEGLPDHPETDPAASSSRHQVAPGIFIETFSMPVQGDGYPPEVGRVSEQIINAILRSIGGGNEGTEVREHGTLRTERTSGLGGMFDFSQFQEHAGSRVPFDRSNATFGHPTPFSLGPVPSLVIPDSLTTLSQYLSHMRSEFEAIARDGGSSQSAATHRTEESPNSSAHSEIRQEGRPSPASLAEVIRSTRLLLREEVGDSLLQLASQLENQVNVTDPSARLSTQSSASRTGALHHYLGALLLELGRTTMTLQLGQAPSDAVVNAGPAVFISQTGPNPIMVQPLPFQSGMSFGPIPMGAVQPSSGLGNGLGTAFLPRRIDIQIRRANVNHDEHGDTQQPSGQRNPAASSGGQIPTSQATFAGDPAIRVLPIRAMVATVPPSDSSGSLTNLYNPVLGRFQHASSGLVSGDRGAAVSGEPNPAGLHANQQSSESAGDPARAGSTLNVRHQEPSITRSVSINILTAGGTQNGQESERSIPSSVLQFIRGLFPEGEIHVEDANGVEIPLDSVSDQATRGNTGVPDAEPRVSDEGIFLSNLLHQVMPIISQAAGGDPGSVRTEVSTSSEHRRPEDSSTRAESSNGGSSRRQSDSEPHPPSSKRQKME